ncbi:MAG: hypothetical protein HOI23_20935 [Deltaproteobacteria bacterium]|nr:hypothetical protein [Deltaproteobacteria bacterium]MBT6433006.1 hypothetical protein [Deltaproteobacteria bacterium]
MMERTWTTKQVISLLMALATGLQITYQIMEQTTPMDSIDRLLNACVSQSVAPEPTNAHLQVFQESLEPGFFTLNFNSAPNFHEDVMELSDESFLALVSNLSDPPHLRRGDTKPMPSSPRKGL